MLYRQNHFYITTNLALPKLDMKFLNKLSENIKGKLIFYPSVNSEKDLKNTECNVFESFWTQKSETYTFHIKANRFLHHMIRYIVGSMIGVYQNRLSKEFILLINKPRKNVTILKVPPRD